MIAGMVLLCTKRKRNFLTEKLRWTEDCGSSTSMLLNIAVCLKERIIKAIISIVLSDEKDGIYDQGGCWL